MSEFLRSNLRIANPDGTPTREFLDIFNRLVSQGGGQGRDRLNEIATGVEGTTPLLRGVGLVSDLLATQDANISNAAQVGANTSDLSVALSATSAYKSGATGSALTTLSVTATPSGGGTPYVSEAWTRVSGSTNITANTPSAATTTFTSAATTEAIESAQFCYAVEETGGDTVQACVSVTFSRTSGGVEP